MEMKQEGITTIQIVLIMLEEVNHHNTTGDLVVEIEVHQTGHRLGHIVILDLTQIQVQVHLDPTVHQVVQVIAILDRLLLLLAMQVAHHQVVDHRLDPVEEGQDNFNEKYIDITYGFGAIIH